MNIEWRILIALVLLALAGCTPSIGVRPSAPLIVTRTQYVPVPAELLAPCPHSAPSISTWGDLAQAYLSIRAQLSGCAAQVDAIRTTQQENSHDQTHKQAPH